MHGQAQASPLGTGNKSDSGKPSAQRPNSLDAQPTNRAGVAGSESHTSNERPLHQAGLIQSTVKENAMERAQKVPFSGEPHEQTRGGEHRKNILVAERRQQTFIGEHRQQALVGEGREESSKEETNSVGDVLHGLSGHVSQDISILA